MKIEEHITELKLKSDKLMKQLLSERQFQLCIKAGIYKESDRDEKVIILQPLKVIDFEKYEREQPNTYLNMRDRYIDKFGFVDGIKTKPLKEYFGNQ